MIYILLELVFKRVNFLVFVIFFMIKSHKLVFPLFLGLLEFLLLDILLFF